MSAGSVKPGASGDFDAVLAIGARPVRIDEVLALARGSLRAELDGDPAQRDKLARSRAAVERALETRGGEVYGVTTGVGASADVSIPTELRGDLPHNLMRFHGVGTGRILDETEAGAVVAVRLVSLARGYSGVREVMLERLCCLL